VRAPSRARLIRLHGQAQTESRKDGGQRIQTRGAFLGKRPQLPSVISTYENRIRQLEERRIELNERIANCGRPLRSFDETLRTLLDFLENPWNLWASERLEHKKAVLTLAFTDRLSYVRNEGFRTPALALPFKVLEDLKSSK